MQLATQREERHCSLQWPTCGMCWLRVVDRKLVPFTLRLQGSVTQHKTLFATSEHVATHKCRQQC
jgi:hypothetical protein